MINAKKSEVYDLLVSMHDALGKSIDPILEHRYQNVMNSYDEVIRNEIDELARNTINKRYAVDTDIDMNVTLVPKE